MAIFVADEYEIVIGGVDLSDHIYAVELPIEFDVKETTNFGSGGKKSRLAGLEDCSATIHLFQDYAASEVEATIWPLLGTATTIAVTPTTSAISETNPEYSGSFLVSNWKPIGAQVGEVPTNQVTWPGAGGGITRDVTP